MANVNWPAADKRSLIGKRIDRLDGKAKSTGSAKYSYDINRPGMLYAKVVVSPHAKATIEEIDWSAAKALKGVEGIWAEPTPKDVQYGGQIIAAVAAQTEEIAQEAIDLVKVKYKVLEHQVRDDKAEFSKVPSSPRNMGDVDAALKESASVSEGEYGIPVITHCCLEPHGQVTEFRDGELYVWPSTQNVSGLADGLTAITNLRQNQIHVETQYMGGGFGSKFGADQWGLIGTQLSKQTGMPVKLLLERDVELTVAGNRPSAFGHFKVGVTKEGKINALEADVWGTGGPGNWSVQQALPYVFTEIPNTRVTGRNIKTDRGPSRAWRAPNHPQACFLMMSALEDAAAALKMDALEFFMKNLDLTQPKPAGRTLSQAEVYREELQIAADLIGYKQKAHLRGDKTSDPVKRGLGIGLHTWGGLGHASQCDVTINPDGSVEAKLGSQDLGTGTRTVIAIVVAETLGLPLEAVKVEIGKNAFPPSSGSGGSTTVGGVSTSARRAATDALNAVLDAAAKKLGTAADALEARGGKIQEIGKPSNAIAWNDACRSLGPMPITKRGINVQAEGQRDGMISQGVGGVQIADVSVDTETGIVTINEMVAVQDCGLIIDLKTAESQVYGALIMGIGYGLFEEAVYDVKTGRMLNPDMEFYRLAGLTDVGKLKVHMMTGEGYDERGVIGLGEPPAISPGAAIANAVANACGVRVPELPLTPDRVITALQKGGLI